MRIETDRDMWKEKVKWAFVQQWLENGWRRLGLSVCCKCILRSCGGYIERRDRSTPCSSHS